MYYSSQHDLNTGLVDEQTTKSKPTYSLKKAAGIVAVFALALMVLGVAQTQISAPPMEEVALWERWCATCTACPEDQMHIIAVFFGPKVVTGDFVNMYNNGVRKFPATAEVWGETWGDNKKSFVVVFEMCEHFHTKIIYEGQSLVMP